MSAVPQLGISDQKGLTACSPKHILTTMKILSAAIALCFALVLPSFADDHEQDGKAGAYRHVVCFKFKDDASKEQIAAIEKAFAELPSKIDTITGYEWGTNVSPEGLADGFTHCFVVTFADKKGLEAYIPHAAHRAFVSKLKPILDKVFVIDFVAK